MANHIVKKVTSSTGSLPPVLLDLTQDTVNQSNLSKDETAHNSEGYQITGQMAIEDAEAWAVGTKNGVPVPNTDIQYQNNSKYYASVSGSILQIAGQQAIAAATSANNAHASELAAANSAVISGSYMRVAGEYKDASAASAVISGSYMHIAGEYKEDAEAWADGTRNGSPVPSSDPAYNNNAKYYKDECQSIAGSLTSVLKPKGTCLFADLPSIASSQAGDMWNIEDAFTTTSDFREGAGVAYAAGSNVYLTIDNKWDVLSGSNVVGVKGNAETDFRTGGVNITPANIGYFSASTLSIGGNVPPSQEGDGNKFLKGDGDWANLPVFRGISGSIQSISGMLPAAESGDEDKVFNGRGEWGKRLQIDIVIQNGQYGYINANNEFVDFKSQADIDAAVRDAMVGTATAADVKEGVTFTNSTTSGVVGTFAAQEKEVTAGTSAAFVTPDSGKYLSKVTYNPTPSETKSVNPSTTEKTITPSSGKLLSSVSIGAISPQRSIDQSITGSGIDSSSPFIQTSYGWYPRLSSDVTYARLRMTTAQAQALHKHTATYTPTANSSASDMGGLHNYRYVDTRTVYNLGYNAASVKIAFLGGHPMIGVTSYADWFTTSRAYKYILICGVAINDNTNFYIDITTNNSTVNGKVVSSYNNTTTGGNYGWRVLSKALYYPDVPANVKFQCKGHYGASALAYGVYKD